MTESKLKTIVAKQLGITEESIQPDFSLVDDLHADSLDLLDIVMSIEAMFNITIEDTEYADAATIQNIVALIDSKLSAG
jgi:acyl carrier protein